MKSKPRRNQKGGAARSILRLPDLDVAKSAVLNSLSCPDAQRGYRHAIDELVLLRAETVLQQNGSRPLPNAPGVAQPRSGHCQPSSRRCAPSCVRGSVMAYISVTGHGCIVKAALGEDCPMIAGQLPAWARGTGSKFRPRCRPILFPATRLGNCPGTATATFPRS